MHHNPISESLLDTVLVLTTALGEDRPSLRAAAAPAWAPHLPAERNGRPVVRLHLVVADDGAVLGKVVDCDCGSEGGNRGVKGGIG